MYIVIELQTNADGSIGNFIWAFDSYETAISKFYAVCSSAAVSSLPVHAVVALDNKGMQLAVQYFEHKEKQNG